ncbi:hypothetical protein GGX14DRAFT_406172 [Mycena pura]|uniref:Uncharacterized protein n=1 Tax=Mycena pura TaxID=153505 RepID=A0AAD6UR31_9AGAR|nr:hypothetical protein GGX14DRAFT_406172 [Mycena pura]
MPVLRERDSNLQSEVPVTNFQDLSAILSLLASDTVEMKLSSEENFDWERMSSVWSIFGLIGALRANLKVAASISGSERAGVELFGAGGFTGRQTSRSLCYWKVGKENKPLAWRDSTNQILSRLDASNSIWTHPICVAIAYSRCPWNWRLWRCITEILAPISWCLIMIAIAVLPTLILIPSERHLNQREALTLGTQAATALLAGALAPLLLHRLNSFGLAPLTAIGTDRYDRAGLIREGDHVITSSKRNTPSTTVPRMSGDLWSIRLLCAINAGTILGAYLLNYILLGSASSARQYLWLGAQVSILAGRYILWARRPVWFPQRPPCLFYIVCGSLGPQLSPECHDRIHTSTKSPTLNQEVVEFACASTCSKQSNRAFAPGRVKRNILLKLVNVVPTDIIYAEYTAVGSHFAPAPKGSVIEILRLPWAFVEELYIAQGVILGSNPWALGGLYLGVVLQDGQFMGLTTLHPFAAHVGVCTKPKCTAAHNRYQKHTITMDGYLVSGDVHGEVLHPFHKVEPSLVDWHRKFRSNVDECRQSAKSNGPSHIEIRASSFGPVSRLRVEINRTQPGMDLKFIEAAVENACVKSHDECGPWLCEVDTFSEHF